MQVVVWDDVSAQHLLIVKVTTAHAVVTASHQVTRSSVLWHKVAGAGGVVLLKERLRWVVHRVVMEVHVVCGIHVRMRHRLIQIVLQLLKKREDFINISEEKRLSK